MISFCVAIHNVEKYLGECIESILSQTSNNYEVLLIDDGSEDNSSIICDRYKNNTNVRILHNEHLGVSETRNMAIDEAKGEWIFYVDGDDVVSKYAVEILEKLLENNGCSIVQFKSETLYGYDINIFKNTNNINIEKKCSFDLLKASIYTKDGSIDSKYHLGTVWGKLYNKNYLVKNHIRFNRDCIYAQDLVFNIGAYSCTKEILLIDSDCLYGYRINEESIGRRCNVGLSDHTLTIINAFINSLHYYLSEKQLLEIKENIANRIYILATKPLIADICNLRNTKSYFCKKREFDNIFSSAVIKNSMSIIDSSIMQGTQKMLFFLIKNDLFFMVYMYYVLLQYKEKIKFLH